MPAAVDISQNGSCGDDEDDEPSRHGRFTWTIIGDACVPCLLKKDGSKYVSVRMAEMKVLTNYLKTFNMEMFTCKSVTSFRISKAETALLNTINTEYCERSFGAAEFQKERDFIVRLDELIEYRNFMETCYNKLMRGAADAGAQRCGFIRINSESVVPFTTATKNNVKYLPLFYFEGETEHLRNSAIHVDGWDLAYLKFCCKVQGIRNELFSNDRCEMISLDDIRSYFPEGTVFEDYWPPHAFNNASAAVSQNSAHSWVQSPLLSPAAAAVPVSMQSMTNGLQQALTQQRSNRRPITSTAMNGGMGYTAKAAWPPTTNTGVMMSTGGAYHRLPVQNTTQSVMPNSAAKPNTHVNAAPPTTQRMYQTVNSKGVYYPSMAVSSANGSAHQRGATSSLPNSYTNSMPQYTYPGRQPMAAPQHHRIDNILSSSQQQQQHRLQMNGHHPTSSAAATRPTYVNGMRHSTTTGPPVNAPSQPMNATVVGAPRNANRSTAAAHSDEIIDLLSPPSSPRSRNANVPDLAPIAHSRPLRPLPPLAPIDEMSAPVQGPLFPYTTQIMKYGDASIFTINLKPYAFSELLVPLSDIAGKIFHTDVADLRCKLQQGLKIKLYRPNKMQLQILKDNNKCRSTDEDVPLILLADFRSHYNHLLFLHRNHDAKRPRRS